MVAAPCLHPVLTRPPATPPRVFKGLVLTAVFKCETCGEVLYQLKETQNAE